jgi:hypothetical protein
LGPALSKDREHVEHPIDRIGTFGAHTEDPDRHAQIVYNR